MIDPASPAAALPAGGHGYGLIAVDIAGFTRPDRDADIQLYLHRALYDIVPAALDSAGVPWRDCYREDRGDGMLIVVPPGISMTGIIGPLPEQLQALIRRHNRVFRDAAGMQLRLAAHTGSAYHDGYGIVSTDVNFLCRMLEARPLKRRLASSGAELAIIVSEHLHRDVVSQLPGTATRSLFEPVRFQVKYTRARAWIHIPAPAAQLTSCPATATH